MIKKELNVIFLLFFLNVTVNLHSQTGKVKILSELNNVNIYIDDIFKGTNILILDSVKVGSHCFKATKNEILILEEDITVKPNNITSVWITNSKEIQEKLLVKNQKELDIYNSKKLDILLDEHLVTTLTGNRKVNEDTKSHFFPGYYSVICTNTKNIVTDNLPTTKNKKEVAWFITRGNQKIEELEFATLTNNRVYTDSFANNQQRLKEFKAKKLVKQKRVTDWTCIGFGALFTSGGLLLYNYNVDIFKPNQTSKDIVPNALLGTAVLTGVVSIIYGLIGFRPQIPQPPTFNMNIPLDLAIEQATEYNTNLKKELGLPPNFDLQK
jgi:hypothetical protein